MKTENLRVVSITPLISPADLKREMPLSPRAEATVVMGRERIRRILRGEDSRLVVAVGPCSIHEPRSAFEYAERLGGLREKVADRLEIVMRVYFEKPRTTVGWKGLINDPGLNDSCDVNRGLRLARELMIGINEIGLPVATEFLDPLVPQYIADLVSWAAVGARTTESQRHREMASGLSMPVGFKNGTDGDIQTALDAMAASGRPHSFVGIDERGVSSIIQTTGNPDCHLVLRGGRGGPNYGPEFTRAAAERLRAAGLIPGLMIDCSHANAEKDHRRQPMVWRSILEQRSNQSSPVVGAMIESHLFEGNQPPDDPAKLRYGVSVTDRCLGWEETERLLYTTS